MAVSCVPKDLAAAAVAFKSLDAGPVTLHEIQTWLLAVQAGGSTDPKVLMKQSSEFRGESRVILQGIKTSLLCKILNQ